MAGEPDARSTGLCVVGEPSPQLGATIDELAANGYVEQLAMISFDGLTASITGDGLTRTPLMPDLGPIEGRADALWRAQRYLRTEVVCVIEPSLASEASLSAVLQVLQRAYSSDLVIGGPDVHSATQWSVNGWLTVLTEVALTPALALHIPALATKVPAPLAGIYAIDRELLASMPIVTSNAPSLDLLLNTYFARRIEDISYVQTEIYAPPAPEPSSDQLANEIVRIIAAALVRHGLVSPPSIDDSRIYLRQPDGEMVTRRVAMQERPPLTTV
jgi:hypothetical protein